MYVKGSWAVYLQLSRRLVVVSMALSMTLLMPLPSVVDNLTEV